MKNNILKFYLEIYKIYYMRLYYSNTDKTQRFYNDMMERAKNEFLNGINDNNSEYCFFDDFDNEIKNLINQLKYINENRNFDNNEDSNFTSTSSFIKILFKNNSIYYSPIYSNLLPYQQEYKELHMKHPSTAIYFKKHYDNGFVRSIHSELNLMMNEIENIKNNKNKIKEIQLYIIRNNGNVLSRPCIHCRNMINDIYEENNFDFSFISIYPVVMNIYNRENLIIT